MNYFTSEVYNNLETRNVISPMVQLAVKILSCQVSGEGENGKLFISFAAKKNVVSGYDPLPWTMTHQCQFLTPQKCCCVLTQMTYESNPFFCQVFPARIRGQCTLPLAPCDFFPSPSFLLFYQGTQPRSGHFVIS